MFNGADDSEACFGVGMTFADDRQDFDRGGIGKLPKCLKHLEGDRVFAVAVTEAEQSHGQLGGKGEWLIVIRQETVKLG